MAGALAGVRPVASAVARIPTRAPVVGRVKDRAVAAVEGGTAKMSNGQFHQKNQKKRRYGVKIKNPLRLPVVARITCETGAIRSGAMDGKETTRTIGPGEEIFVSTKGSCELDIKFSVIRYDEVGNTTRLGEAGGSHVAHHDPMGKKGKPSTGTRGEVPKMPTRETEEKKEEPAQDEEVRITTLGDRFRDLEREGVKV